MRRAIVPGYLANFGGLGIVARHTRYLLDYLNNKSTKNLEVDRFFKECILLARYGNVLAPEREDFILRY
uniref:Uncharacterized protein n=1 Tax=Rhizophagus irregularis (strain DAOM 181602 / DAOM 197198 / MUCL 43194) TaxID=747089 RepID=U9URK7_RHIID